MKRSPSFRCVGWDSATFPVLRQRWIFPCIFYIVLICCLSGFLGELALRLKCRWLLRIMTFQLYYASGEEKKQNLHTDLFGSSRGAAEGRTVGVCAVGPASLFKSQWIHLVNEAWPCCHLQRKENPNDCTGAGADFNKGVLCRLDHTEMSEAIVSLGKALGIYQL